MMIPPWKLKGSDVFVPGAVARAPFATLALSTKGACRGGGLLVGSIVLFATRQRKQHRNAFFVAAILVAEHCNEIALFELDADQNVTSRRHREQQMARGHQWRRPEGKQKAQ